MDHRRLYSRLRCDCVSSVKLVVLWRFCFFVQGLLFRRNGRIQTVENDRTGNFCCHVFEICQRHVAPMGVKFGEEEASSMPNFTPIGATTRV